VCLTFDEDNFYKDCKNCNSKQSMFVDFGISYCLVCGYEEYDESDYSD
jgi:hypothetical protein